jgi:hypothetical protein
MNCFSSSFAPVASDAHYCHGQLSIAFVFSVPGKHEKFAGLPIAGVTGENLSIALEYLHSALPAVFASKDRYAYRITNAYNKPIAKSLGNSSSQATSSGIKNQKNIDRVLHELNGCWLVILCGTKAHLLEKFIHHSGQTTLRAWHTSNQALSQKFGCPEVSKLVTPSERRRQRARLWADSLLQCL